MLVTTPAIAAVARRVAARPAAARSRVAARRHASPRGCARRRRLRARVSSRRAHVVGAARDGRDDRRRRCRWCARRTPWSRCGATRATLCARDLGVFYPFPTRSRCSPWPRPSRRSPPIALCVAVRRTRPEWIVGGAVVPPACSCCLGHRAGRTPGWAGPLPAIADHRPAIAIVWSAARRLPPRARVLRRRGGAAFAVCAALDSPPRSRSRAGRASEPVRVDCRGRAR